MADPAHTATCRCGAVSVHFGRPLARAHCHCTICQRVNGAPFGDPVFFWRHAVTVERGAHALRWTRTRWLPMHVNRGVCGSCDQLMIEHIAMSPFSIVMGTAFDDPEALPPVDGHGFYEHRQADVDDGLPKREGYVQSQLGFTRWMLRGLLRGR